jgi:tetratricopeptide (TPR) repeat protein
MGKRLVPACLMLIAAAAAFAASTFFDKGEELFVQNKPQDARPLLESALADDPANEKTYLYLGIIYQQLGDTRKAVDILQKGLDVASSWKDLFYYNIGNDLFAGKDYAGAADMYSKAIAVNKDLSDAYLNRANARMKVEAWDGAVADYTLYLQLQPQTPQRQNIEKIIALLRKAQDDQARAAQADADRKKAEAEKQKALMDQILSSLSNAGSDTQNLSVETIKGQNDPVDVDIKD